MRAVVEAAGIVTILFLAMGCGYAAETVRGLRMTIERQAARIAQLEVLTNRRRG